VHEIRCVKLKSRYEDLYMSAHVEVRVNAADMKSALDLFMSNESWPTGVFLSVATSNLSIKMSAHNLTLSSFNRRSVKSSVDEIYELCQASDFVFLQEHWLLPFELDFLQNLHPDLKTLSLLVARSAVDISNQLLIGRPYGGTAILFRKDLSSCVSILETYDPRLTAIRLTTNIGPVMLVCVYMPSDVGDLDCVLNCNKICSKINALYAESDVAYAIVAGDFNCQMGSRFYNIFFNFAQDCGLEISDSNRLIDYWTSLRSVVMMH